MRPDASTSKHLVDIGRHLIRVAIQMRDWSSVSLQAGKIGGLVAPDAASDPPRYLKTARGIAALETGAFEDAAHAFTTIPAAAVDRPWTEGDVASPNDVAAYGAILGLATMERPALRSNVLESATFRPYLELEPHLRKALGFYVNGKYKACLEILEAYRADYMLDIHLYRHIPALYERIRTKCIVQYLIPYSYISMESLAETFGRSGESIAREICQMIRGGALDARINSIDKVSSGSSISLPPP
ncbi:PCI domain-containing protein [Candidatus Bathyarchaeota archaeon]|nr:PCI domain-containing protein [Candidatus Bathyarchaeota archaeon]